MEDMIGFFLPVIAGLVIVVGLHLDRQSRRQHREVLAAIRELRK
jgi:hypothetical protein